MITKEAAIKNKFTKDIYLASAARVCFEHLLKHLDFSNDEKILLPAYIGETDTEGSGVFDPVRNIKTNFDFYSITKNLFIDKPCFEQKIKSGKFKAVLIIHYFGFINEDIEWIVDLCNKNNVILIEDCAHTFQSEFKGKKAGSFGAFSFYSIHKLIATDDGGFIQHNSNKIHIPLLVFNEQNIKPETIEQLYKTDISKTSEIRINNYKKYLQLLKGKTNGFEIMHNELPEGIVPLNFPILIDNNNREKVYFKLIDKGIITCALYYRLVHEIDARLFPLSYQISGSIINLPVHQDTTLEDVEFIVNKLLEIINEL